MENGKTYFEDRGAYVLLTIQSRWLNIRLQYIVMKIIKLVYTLLSPVQEERESSQCILLY